MKTKNNKLIVILTTLLTLLPVILGIILYDRLPEQIPTHFNSAGEADGYSSRNMAVFGLPAFLAFMNLFVIFSLNTDPKKQNANKTLRLLSKFVMPAASCIFVPLSLLYAIGYEIDMHIIVQFFVGIIFIVIGNYMPKSKQSYTVGIKLPWTLNNEHNWNKTHRLAGILYVISGIILIISGLMQFNLSYIIFFVLILCTGIPSVYSYLLYRQGH